MIDPKALAQQGTEDARRCIREGAPCTHAGQRGYAHAAYHVALRVVEAVDSLPAVARWRLGRKLDGGNE